MADKKQTEIATREARDPFALLRQMTSELDRAFDEPFWPGFRFPSLRSLPVPSGWSPRVDVVEKDSQLVTRIDLPGVKKEDVSVEIIDGRLVLSGERKSEIKEEKGNVHRSECEYGSFYRAVPLPEGVSLDDVKATFAGGVLEISVPLPARPASTARRIDIQEPAKAAKPAA